MSEENKNYKKELNEEMENSNKWFRSLVVFGSTLLISILFFIRYSKPDFPTGYLIISGVVIILLGVILFFIKDIKERFLKQEDEKEKENILPPPKTIAEIIPLCQKTVINKEYADLIPHISTDSPTGIRKVGENPTTQIFEYHSRGLYSNRHYVILMNMHYPEKYQVLINPPKLDITKWINFLAEKKDKQPDEEETRTINPLLGTEQIIKKKIHNKDKNKEENKKEDNQLK